MRVDVHALPPATSHHDDFGGEACTFNVKLEPIALCIADGRAAGAAAAFGPAPTDLVLVIGRELADKIEIVAVTRTAKLEIDFALRATRAVSGVAADALGGPVFRPQRSCPGPVAGKIGEGACLRQRRWGIQGRGQGYETEAEKPGG